MEMQVWEKETQAQTLELAILNERTKNKITHRAARELIDRTFFGQLTHTHTQKNENDFCSFAM